MARVTKEFVGVKDGEVYPTEFKIGDEVDGELAVIALKERWAVANKDDVATKSLNSAPENK